jgi:hypothetical protein
MGEKICYQKLLNITTIMDYVVVRAQGWRDISKQN